MRSVLVLIVLLVIQISLFMTCAGADTVFLKDGKEVKGIVVEDYRDRVVFSTADGEVSLMKSDMQEIYFDSKEDNLIKLAEQARERKNYLKSYAYYDMALRVNPNSKIAKDGIVFLQGYLYRKDEAAKIDDIKRREEFEKYGTILGSSKTSEEAQKESAAKLKKMIGITLNMQNEFPQVVSVDKDSPASDAGVRKGDYFVAIWGRLTGYMPLNELINALLDEPSLEIKCTIERTRSVVINPRRGLLSSLADMIGAQFSMEFDGLTISDVRSGGSAMEAGLEKGDLIVSIDGKSTRYMPLSKAIDMIRNSKSDSVDLTLRRNMLIWRKSL